METVNGGGGGIKNPEEQDYKSAADLFATEHLDDGGNWAEVRDQMDKIRSLVEQYMRLQHEIKTDMSKAPYLDELILNIEEALRHFKINGKIVDVGKLVGGGDTRDIYNRLVSEINGHNEMFGVEEVLQGM